MHVIEVRPERPCAAVGRNAGWRAAQGEFVLFLDGDTELHPAFVARALREMRNPRVAVVWGHRREIRPEQSVYVRVLDLDWVYAPGPSEFCGGDALMRRRCLAETGGFDDSLIAGEELELCRRNLFRGLTLLALQPLVLLRSAWRCRWKSGRLATCLLYAVHSQFQQLPIFLGQLAQRRDARRGLCRGLIDYKQAS